MLKKIRKTLREKRLAYLTTDNKPLSIAIALLIFSLFAIATPLISIIMVVAYVAVLISTLKHKSAEKTARQDDKQVLEIINKRDNK